MTLPVVGINIDIETKSSTDIKKHGVYRYVEDADHEVLVIAYSLIHEHPGGRRSRGKPRPLNMDVASERARFVDMLVDPLMEKHAYNAAFERINLSKWLGMPNGTYLDPANWHCTAILANTNGVFGTLDDVGRALRTPVAKDKAGKALIKLFSIPDRKAQKFHKPAGTCWCGAKHAPQFEEFVRYCCTDVMAEMSVGALLAPMFPETQAEYEADQRINDRGFRHHQRMSEQAVAQVAIERDRVMDDMRTLTGVDNPNSPKQLGEWLDAQGYPMVSLDKKHRADAQADPFIPPQVSQMLTLKEGASLSSVAKHQAALNTRCADGRIRGSLQFHGAHTGREAGRGIQPQNLPRYEASLADAARLLNGTAGRDAPLIAKGTVRGTIVPARGHKLVVADYNAIEARVLAGLAGERWAEDEFVNGAGKIYERTAANMFGVDYDAMVAALKVCDKCGKCEWCGIRARAKVANLALGYAGGAGALVTMGAADAGLDVGNYPSLNAEWKAAGSPGKFHMWERDRHDYDELKALRDTYREASPATVRFWKLNDKAWDLATAGKGARYGQNQCITMMRDGKHNRMVLPSGRSIWYRFGKTHYDPDSPEYVDRRTFIGKAGGIGHARVDTHGGKLTENVTQAVARDIMFDAIMRVEAMTATGWPGRIVLHVHDELVLEAPTNQADQVLADVLGLMSVAPTWGQFFAVRGEGNVMDRYGK